MATNPVNLVDAIVTATGRQARNRTAVMRTGVVISIANEWCQVRVASNDNTKVISAGYHTNYQPRVGEIVDLLNDSDRWVVLGEQAGPNNYVQEPSIQSGVELMALAGTSATLAMTFPRAYSAMPAVVANFASGAGGTASFVCKAINVTTTGCMLFPISTSATTYTGSINQGWIASGYYTGPPTIPASLAIPELEPGHHYAVLTCHTPGCLKDGVPVPRIILPDVEPEGYLNPRCGLCSQDIVDVVH